MHDHEQAQQYMTPEEAQYLAEAKEVEMGALSQYLQQRVVVLSAEVRRRDARIAALETEVQSYQAAHGNHPAPDPWGDTHDTTADTSSGDQPH